MPTPVWISLGSNLGDRRAILEAALVSIAQVPGLIVRAVSSFHETKPVGGPPGQGPFLNAAAHLETSLDPYQLLAALQQIENQAGRVRVVRWGERTLDLDILIFGTKFLDTSELKLPHPRLAFRRFVLAPLAEIASQIVDTMTKRTIADLLANLDRKPRLLAIDGRDGLGKKVVFNLVLEKLPSFAIERKTHSSPEMGARELWAEKIEAIRTDQWRHEANWNNWGCAYDFVDPGEFDEICKDEVRPHLSEDSIPETFINLGLEEVWLKKVRISNWMKRMQRAKKNAAIPILAVVLPDDQNCRRPGVCSIPQLWPESNEPEAIVAEIIATCRGIEGI